MATTTTNATTTMGVHHIALVCKNMKETVTFYEKALGMELKAVFPMHGVSQAKHCFLDAGNGMQLSFVEFGEPKDGVPGVSYAATQADECPATTMHHLAFKASSLENLYALRDRVKAAGVKPSPVLDHNFVHSFYFSDPNNFHLEISCDVAPYTEAEMQVEIMDRKLKPEEHAWTGLESMQKAAKMRPAKAKL